MSDVTMPMAWEWPNTPGQWPSNHRRNAVGHQGLFFDRLEATGPATTDGLGAGGRQLVAEAWPSVTGVPTASSPRGLYQNRNRTLDPVLGRFLQRDPNASGAVVVVSLCTGGASPFVLKPGSDPDVRLTDGASLYEALRSSPMDGTDALGLYMSPLDTLSIGAEIFGNLQRVIMMYADNQEAASDWASDWSQPDDLFDGPSDIGNGKELAEDEALDEGGDDGPAVMNGASGFRALRAAIKSRGWKFGRVFDDHNSALAAKRGMGFGKRVQAHHVFPQSWGKVLGMPDSALKNGPSVILGNKRHQVYTTKLNRSCEEFKRLQKGGQLKSKADQRAWMRDRLA